MDFRILGPLEVYEEGQPLVLGGRKQRTLLGALLVRANTVVSAEHLVDELWGEAPPESAVKLVQGYVSGLRKVLGSKLVTRAPGYVLRVDRDELDLFEYHRLADEAKMASLAGDSGRARELLVSALALWRGEALGNVELRGPLASEVESLAELRLATVVERIDLDLELGRPADLVAELEALTACHPHRERLRGQLMLALYRSGRQVDALGVYRETRRYLADQLGLEPGDALHELERAILRHDPALEAPTKPPSASQVTAADVHPAAAPREERKLATVLLASFADDPGTSKSDPETARALDERAYRRLAHEVERHGGTLEHAVGGLLLGVFGVPLGHEDDSERAVRAGLAMLAAARELDRDSAPRGLRIAVDAGEVLAAIDGPGSGGRVLAGEVVGSVTKLLARARAAHLVVGSAVHAATRNAVDYRELPRGRGAGTQLAWEALRPRRSRPGERSPLNLEAPLIGRDEDVSLLRQTVHRVSLEGRPVLVTVLGPAGIGKSRLVGELLRHVEELAEPICVRVGRCVAYGNVSYSALSDAVKAECAILDDDPPPIVADKVTHSVERLFGDRAAVSSIETLVGSGQEHTLSREELFDAWRRLLERMAARSPLIVVLEDLHWADDGLLDFVDHVADWAEGPILVLTLARPELLERRPGWGGGKRNYLAISLEPLAVDETRELVRTLLEGDMADDLVRVVSERCDGNPLFGEEIVRMLIDRHVLREGEARRWQPASAEVDAEVPRSVRAVIAARLDALPAEEKELLQAAAVVGRTFWLGAAQRLVASTRQKTRELLTRLRAKDILVARDPPRFSGELEYAFRHVLIRDVAYDSLPKSRRVDLHVEMARWAAEHAGGRQDEIAELLATHYQRALGYVDELGDAQRRGPLARETYRWARNAGERAHRLWQQREAARWFRVALDASPGVGPPPKELAELWESYGNACEGVEPYAEVAAAFESALTLFDELGDDAAAGRMEAWRAFVAFQSGEDDLVPGWSQRALARLEPLGQSRELALALIILGWAHRRSGRFDEAEPLLRRALDIAAAVGDDVVQAQAAVSLGKCLQQAGQVGEGLPLLVRALELARQAGHLPVLLRALLDLSEAHEEATGDYRQAEKLAREGLELARRAGHLEQIAWMESNLADYLVDMGRLEEAGPLARSGLEAARAVGEPRRIGLTLPTVILLDILRGELEPAERSLEELRAVIAQVDEWYIAVWEPLLRGLIALARGAGEEAAAILREGALRHEGRTEIWGGAWLLCEAARALVGVGRAEDALEFRDRLGALSAYSVPAAAFLAWANGLVEPDPASARALLCDAADRFERLERRVELARCLVDVARAERRLGEDATPRLREARTLLESCGATVFLPDVSAPDVAIGAAG